MLSIIIPLAKGEKAHNILLNQLKILPKGSEILVVFAEGDVKEMKDSSLVSYLTSEGGGRAKSINIGISKAKNDTIWCLHADTRLNDSAIKAAEEFALKNAKVLWYFDLKFYDKPHALMWLNELGVWFRSHILGIPFGDQGFLAKKELYSLTNGYEENLNYGEDHIFVWKCKQHNIPVKSLGKKLYTSARKYKSQGWLRTTISHQLAWMRQAYPEWKKKRKKCVVQ